MSVQQTLAALADPVRYRIVELLAGGEYSVGDIARQMPVSRSAVSQHLRVLVKITLVQERRDGRFHHYRLRSGALPELAQHIARWGEMNMPAPNMTTENDAVDTVVVSLLHTWPEMDPIATAVLTRLQLITRLMQTLMTRAARAEGIMGPDVIMLGTLRRLGPPYASTPTLLSRTALLSLPVMTKRLEALRRRGLIMRRADADDGRSSLIVLTPRGAAVIDRIVRQQHMRNFIALAHLPIAARRQLADSLRKLVLSFQKVVRQTSDPEDSPAA